MFSNLVQKVGTGGGGGGNGQLAPPLNLSLSIILKTCMKYNKRSPICTQFVSEFYNTLNICFGGLF